MKKVIKIVRTIVFEIMMTIFRITVMTKGMKMARKTVMTRG